MSTSTISADGQTRVPEEVREALRLREGDRLTWEVQSGTVSVTVATGRPAFWRWEGFLKGGADDAVADVEQARAMRGRD
jgi:bifunctional DNA-binding transcriptional regulator/antitoxin component of YhaV-PrlF toxin-antitoxin module